jgi:hypothetical protein
MSRRKINWSRVQDGGLTPRLTGRPTVDRNMTATSMSDNFKDLQKNGPQNNRPSKPSRVININLKVYTVYQNSKSIKYVLVFTQINTRVHQLSIIMSIIN